MLDYSRIEAGRIEIDRAPFAVAEMLDGVLAIVRPRAIESGVRLAGNGADIGAPHRLGDAGKIQQVLLNLVGNAMKFSPRGTVSVGVRPVDGHDGRLRFEVVDDGIGIDGAVLPRLFEPFTQIHPHTTDRGQGAGLGLAISRALVAGMGGEIGAEPRAEGGSRFWFELDLPAAAAPAYSDGIASSAETGEQPARTILMVEDDDVNRVVGKTLLERRGHRVLVARTGMDGVRMAREHRVDVVLMDIRLPDIDGFEAARRIRTRAAGAVNHRRPPIIALTAQVDPSDASACEAAGIDALVVKPFSPDDLCRRMEALLPGDAPPSADADTDVAGNGDWLDPRMLAEHFRALGPEPTARILEAFEVNTEQMLAALAGSDADRARLVDPAHRLAGSAATLGLPRLRALAAELERAARTGNGELNSLSARMPDAIGASHRCLRAYWSSLRGESSASSM